MDPLLPIAVGIFLSYRAASFSDISEYITIFTPTAVFFFYFAEQLVDSASSSGPEMCSELNLSRLFLQPPDVVLMSWCHLEMSTKVNISFHNV